MLLFANLNSISTKDFTAKFVPTYILDQNIFNGNFLVFFFNTIPQSYICSYTDSNVVCFHGFVQWYRNTRSLLALPLKLGECRIWSSGLWRTLFIIRLISVLPGRENVFHSEDEIPEQSCHGVQAGFVLGAKAALPTWQNSDCLLCIAAASDDSTIQMEPHLVSLKKQKKIIFPSCLWSANQYEAITICNSACALTGANRCISYQNCISCPRFPLQWSYL